MPDIVSLLIVGLTAVLLGTGSRWWARRRDIPLG
jgi:hypothetical protein